MHLKNFMCHQNLKSNLIQQVITNVLSCLGGSMMQVTEYKTHRSTFIGGENGSGKSTILATISFGLGVR